MRLFSPAFWPDRISRRELRLGSGLVLFTYLALHLLNHALGLISVQAAEAGLRWAVALWHSLPGTVLLYGAAGCHVALALVSVHERRTLRMPAVHALRIVLGFWMPVALITHFTGTRIAHEAFGQAPEYARIVPVLWTPEGQGRQLALLVPGWIHGCLGLKFAFGSRRGYKRLQPWLFGAALLLPVLAGLGFVAMARELLHFRAMAGAPAASAPDPGAALWRIRDLVLWAYLAIISAMLLARQGRLALERRANALVSIVYPQRTVQVPRGWTVLEASRSFDIPHLSLCGGNARCSTCRVRVTGGADGCPPPGAAERQLLQRIGAGPGVRLACQLRPRGDVSVVPMLAAQGERHDAGQALQRTAGREMVILLADLRRAPGAPGLGPAHDVAYALQRFHQAFGDAVLAAGGMLCAAQGNEAAAIFGLHEPLPLACQRALGAMAPIEAAIARLDDRLAADLGARGALVLAAHAGSIVYGLMGHPEVRATAAVGPALDVVRRLRDLGRARGGGCAVSEAVLRPAGVLPRSEEGLEDAGLDEHASPLRVLVAPAAAALPACRATSPA